MNIDLLRLLVVSAITMGLAHTLTQERVFAPLRDRLGGKTTWLGYLISCPYCASHYIAFVLVPLTGSWFVPIAPAWGFVTDVLEWFLSAILVTVVAAFLRVIFYATDERQGLLRREKQRVETEVEAARRALRS